MEFGGDQAFDAIGDRAREFVKDLHVGGADQHGEGDSVAVEELAHEGAAFVAQKREGVFVLCAVSDAVLGSDLAAACVGVFGHDVPHHQTFGFVFLVDGFEGLGL